MDSADADVLAFMTFPNEHRAKIHSTNPLEGVNGEIKRRSDVVGIFPNEDAVVRLVGALLLEQNDEWAIQRARHMTLETIAHSAMIHSSRCRHRQRDAAAQPAQEQCSYTARWDTIAWRLLAELLEARVSRSMKQLQWAGCANTSPSRARSKAAETSSQRLAAANQERPAGDRAAENAGLAQQRFGQLSRDPVRPSCIFRG